MQYIFEDFWIFPLHTGNTNEYVLLLGVTSDSPSTRKCNVGRCWRLWKTVTYQAIIFYCWVQDLPDYADTVMTELKRNRIC